MRRRLGYALFGAWSDNGHRSSLALELNRELGTNLQLTNSSYEFYWPDALDKMKLRDALDAVTVVAHHVARVVKAKFLTEVRRIFAEERVRYSVDDLGGVHFQTDVAFEQNRITAVSSLASARYEAVRTALDEAYAALDEVPSDAKHALRSTFFAAEGLFRLIFPAAYQLSAGELNKHLKPRIDQKFDGQKPAIYVAHKQLAQLSDWIDGAHFYRHEPGTEEPTHPPLDMAINYVSIGTSWIRWLRTFDDESQ